MNNTVASQLLSDWAQGKEVGPSRFEEALDLYRRGTHGLWVTQDTANKLEDHLSNGGYYD